MLTIKTNLANRSNYGKVRDLKDILWLVVHYTGIEGDSDEKEGIYFAREVTYTSAHYFVDSDSVTQIVPDNHVAFHCGGYSYRHPTCRNENSIGVEICDDVRNGVIYPNAQTIANAVEHAQSLMDRYNIPKTHVIRHYDVTGKKCPAYWVDDAKWKAEFLDKLREPNTKAVFTVTVTGMFDTMEAAMGALDVVSGFGFSGTITTKQATPVPSQPVVPETDKTIEEVAREVIAGKYGYGHAVRKKKLTEEGYDYETVRQTVNRLLGYQ